MISYKNILHNMKKSGLIVSGDRIIVGFSGGPDSVFMTEMLSQLRNEMDISIILVHLNHMLRGQDALDDERFVIEYGKAHDYDTVIQRTDVGDYARKNRLTTEEAGRKIRYELFDNTAKEKNCNKIALAHNKDDQIETFMFKLIRGSSLSGLEGIRSYDRYIRPISDIYKKDILNYLDNNSIQYCTDKTNSETDYTRNSIRLDLIPYIENKYNIRFKDKIFNLINDIRHANRILKDLCDEVFINDRIHISDLLKKPEYLQNMMLNDLLCKHDISASRNKIDNMRSLLKKGGTVEISLDDNHYAVKDYDYIMIFPKTEVLSRSNESQIFKLPGKIIFGEYELLAETYDEPEKSDKYTFYTCLIPGDTIIVRHKRPGDEMVPIGMKNKKKLKDIFINEKIPRYDRNTIPILEKDGDIIWAVSVKKSNIAKYAAEDKGHIHIKILARRKIHG